MRLRSKHLNINHRIIEKIGIDNPMNENEKLGLKMNRTDTNMYFK